MPLTEESSVSRMPKHRRQPLRPRRSRITALSPGVAVTAVMVLLLSFFGGPGALATGTPDPETGRVSLISLDEDGGPLAGAAFVLTGEDGTRVDVMDGADGDHDAVPGIVEVRELPVGTYLVTQTSVPQPYVPAADPQPVTVQGGAADHFTELVFHGVLPVEDDEDHATGTVDPVADTADEEQAPESAVADAATAPGSADVEDRNTTRDGDKGRSTTAVGGDGVVTPMAVPSPGSGAAVITVKVGDRRASGSAPTDSSVTGLPGVTLRLLTDNNGNPGQPVNQPWATCQSDPDGDCSFVVP